jgi:hypothetical protein
VPSFTVIVSIYISYRFRFVVFGPGQRRRGLSPSSGPHHRRTGAFAIAP